MLLETKLILIMMVISGLKVADDIIISSGYTIGPFEVEDALTNHAPVKECAVVASPHDIRGIESIYHLAR